MELTAIYAHLSCHDLARSAIWFAALFGREPDARPMQGLVEWHNGQHAGFQLFQDGGHAGQGTLTLIVPDIQSEHRRLVANALEPGEIESADYTTIMRLHDPDGNLVVLAQPRRP